jgi:hypothetical protein
MPSDYRHHHAAHPAVVLVIGSPEPQRHVKPGPYKRDQRQPWRPRTKPPNKVESLKRLLDGFRRQDEAVRAFMTPNAALVRAWRAA